MGLLDIIATLFGPKADPTPSVAAPAAFVAAPLPTIVISPAFAAPSAVAASPAHGVGIRVDHLTRMGASQADAIKYVGYINEGCERFHINNHARICAFIAQTCEESGNLSTVNENLHYRADVVCRLWSRFSYATASAACNAGPEAVGNLIYGGRMGNVNPGDGFKFRGRGFIQLTGHDNYAASSKRLGIDLVANPDLVSQPEYAALTAADFWQNAGCNELSDPDNEDAVRRVTQRVNGGQINIDIRMANWRKAESIFSDLK